MGRWRVERFRREEFLFRSWPADKMPLRLDSVGWTKRLQRAMQTADNTKAQLEETEKSKNLRQV